MFRYTTIIAAAALTAVVATGTAAQPAPEFRTIIPPEAYILSDDRVVDHVTVKFREGSAVRLDGPRFVTEDRSGRDARSLRDGQLTASDVTLALDTINRMVTEAADVTLGSPQPTFTAPPEDLRRLRETGERRTGKTLADLTLYYRLPLMEGTVYGDVAELVRSLNALPAVEIAYASAPGSDPQVDIPPTTPDFEADQGYLDPAPEGIDARYAWTVPGGTGTNVRIMDVEQGLVPDHEDLPPLIVVDGPLNPDSATHGTSVMGVLVAADNGYGVTGIAHGARAGLVSHFGPRSWANAVILAALYLEHGDIMVIEIQDGGPANGQSCPPGCPICDREDNSVPMEWEDENFVAVEFAVANGIVVVAAAGNGRSDLDDPVYQGAFDRSVRDSGAIIVGASQANSRVPTCFSNYGDRVDLHGWGRGVVTLGRGDIFDGVGDAGGAGSPQQSYWDNFSGTSSATPIVAGAAALVQSAVIAAGGTPLTSVEMRDVLRAGATPQAPDARNIGPLPNLRGAIDAALHPECAPPAAGDWVVAGTCVVSRNRSAPADVEVQDGARLIVLPTATLDVAFEARTLRIRPAGQVLVHPGGRIR